MSDLTKQVVIDLSVAAVESYRICRDSLGMTHEEAVEQITEEAEESFDCLTGECMH